MFSLPQDVDYPTLTHLFINLVTQDQHEDIFYGYSLKSFNLTQL